MGRGRGASHCRGNRTQVDELIALADERGAPYWKALGTAVRGLIDRVVGNKPIPASVRQDIIERSDGIPNSVPKAASRTKECARNRPGYHIDVCAVLRR
jgi:hypothetical protein